MLELDRMVQDSLRDIPSDEEMSDTEDPDLLVSKWSWVGLWGEVS